MKKKDLYYSEKQARVSGRVSKQLDVNGPYTEAVEPGKYPNSAFDDFVFVGSSMNFSYDHPERPGYGKVEYETQNR